MDVTCYETRNEQFLHLLDILDGNLGPLPLLAGESGHGDELYGVPRDTIISLTVNILELPSPQTRLIGDLGEDGQAVLGYLRVLLLRPDLEDLLELLLLVLSGGDDDGPVQQVQRQAMRTGVLGTADLGDP